MPRLLLPVLAAAAVGGFAVGWVVLSSPRDGPSCHPAPPSATAATHRFPLTAADVRLDREVPAVAADARGRVLLAWASQTGAGERTLWLARSADGGATFEKPAPFRKVSVYRYTTKMRGKETTRTTSVAPRLSAAGETVYLGWTEAVGGGPRVDFLVARTADGGATFSEPVRVHGGDAGRPGFTALRAAPDGGVASAWLDSRKRGQQPYCGVALSDDGKFLPEQLVYPGPAGRGICPCCDVDVLRTPAGETLVAFRNNDNDYRDICVARARAASGPFEAPVPVSAEHWRFEGCPHDGPSLALGGGRLHVLWMDAHAGKRRVYHASADPTDLRFMAAAEVAPDAPGEQGHPRLAAAAGVLHAAWDGSQGDAPEGGKGHEHHARPAGARRAILYARAADGAGFGPARALDPRPGAFQVNPALAVGPAGDVCVAWSEITEEGKCVAFARMAAPPK